jgi:hypothetical protein
MDMGLSFRATANISVSDQPTTPQGAGGALGQVSGDPGIESERNGVAD